MDGFESGDEHFGVESPLHLTGIGACEEEFDRFLQKADLTLRIEGLSSLRRRES